MNSVQVKKIPYCRICKNKNIKRVFTLGSTPLANSFLTNKQLDSSELYFPLEVYFCTVCSLLQLGHFVHPDLLFRKYLYVSSTSPVFIKHFKDYAQEVLKKFKLNKKSLVVDIGSNDGILLRPFKKLGVRVLGVDPARNIAKRAIQDGIPTIGEYFNQDIAKEIVSKHGRADVITANNVFAHVYDLGELTRAVKILLAKNGVFIIEVPYLIDFLEKTLFDTIYHEHLSYYSLKPLRVFFERHRMQVFDVQKVNTHGGSVRVFVKNKNARYTVQTSVKKFLESERKFGVYSQKTFLDFAEKVQKNKAQLTNILHTLKNQGKKIVGYGAPAKGNTLLNYFGIGNDILDYIVDDNPLKQGLFTPGKHIQVVGATRLYRDPPDYILILAWNFANPIMEKLSDLSKKGVGFIIPAPEPTIIRNKDYIHHAIVEEDLSKIINDLGIETKKLSGATVLISGGSGFLGSYINQTLYYLNKHILKRKCRVISLDNYITGTDKKNFLGEIDDENFEFIYHDVRLPFLIREDIDYVIHAAGLASPYYYQKYPLETIESAIVGAKNLLELARSKNVRGFLFFSSSEIYGNPDPKFVPIPETYAGHVSSVGPRACYDESKRLGETLCLVYHQQFGVPVKIVRPFNIYGPGMKPDDYRVIPTFIYKGIEGKYLPVHGPGNQTRTFCYASDAIVGFLRVLLSGKPGGVYNVGNDKPELTMLELAKEVARILANGVKIKTIDYPSSYPAGEPQRRCPDLTKIKSQFGYNPSIDLAIGLKRSIEWFRSKYNL